MTSFTANATNPLFPNQCTSTVLLGQLVQMERSQIHYFQGETSLENVDSWWWVFRLNVNIFN